MLFQQVFEQEQHCTASAYLQKICVDKHEYFAGGEKNMTPPPFPFFYLGAHLLIDLLQAQHFLCIPVYNNEVLYDHVN